MAAALLLVMTAAPPARADIYKYVDENGVIHFTNAPTNARYRLYVPDSFFDGGSAVASLGHMPDHYDGYIRAACNLYGVSFPLVKAMIKVESGFNPRAVSRAGALGLMQIMPFNLELLSIQDPFDPWENIRGGTRFIRSLLDRFDNKLTFALAGYNAGPERVDRYNGIPPYKETQNYVRKVLGYYRMLKQ